MTLAVEWTGWGSLVVAAVAAGVAILAWSPGTRLAFGALLLVAGVALTILGALSLGRLQGLDRTVALTISEVDADSPRHERVREGVPLALGVGAGALGTLLLAWGATPARRPEAPEDPSAAPPELL